jgi:hypothetical protein
MVERNGSGRRGRGMAGGSLLALSLVGGVVIGTAYGEPSIGFLVGLGLGMLFLLLVWMLDRRP